MTQVLRWFAPGEVEHDISERVDNGGQPRFRVTTYAEECSIASSTIVVRDEDGDFHIVGLNRFDIVEEDSIGPDPYIWVGRFHIRVEKRGRYLTGASRDIEATIEDLNNTASRYIVGDTEDADRPEEDHADRIAWLLGTDACVLLTDTSLVLTTTSVTMPAYDYTGMTPQQVIDDCARASGYQNFIWYNGETDELGLAYARSSGSWYSTDIRLSNVIAEVDDTTTFYLGADASLEWDPSRVASRVFARGDGVDTVRTNDPTEDLFGRSDHAMDFPTVRSDSVLATRTDRALENDLDTETATVKGTVYLPSTVASQFKAGMRFELHATHLTGFQDDFAAVRLVMTTHELLTPTVYKIEWEAEPLDSPIGGDCASFEFEPTPSDAYGPLNSGITPSGQIAYYSQPGIPAPVEPDPGHVGGWHFPDIGTGGSPDYAGVNTGNQVRVMVVGAGTIVVETATYDGIVPLQARLMHWNYVIGEEVVDETQTGETGDTFTFEVSTHAGADCIHFVDYGDTSAGLGSKFGYAGSTWTSTEV